MLNKKMHKSAPYLYLKSANRVLKMVLFLMLWCLCKCCSLNSFKKAPFEDAIPASFCLILMLYYHHI